MRINCFLGASNWVGDHRMGQRSADLAPLLQPAPARRKCLYVACTIYMWHTLLFEQNRGRLERPDQTRLGIKAWLMALCKCRDWRNSSINAAHFRCISGVTSSLRGRRTGVALPLSCSSWYRCGNSSCHLRLGLRSAAVWSCAVSITYGSSVRARVVGVLIR